jgi:hypothetical protein
MESSCPSPFAKLRWGILTQAHTINGVLTILRMLVKKLADGEFKLSRRVGLLQKLAASDK